MMSLIIKYVILDLICCFRLLKYSVFELAPTAEMQIMAN